MFVSRNGRWLSDPVAVLRANGTSALLQLANPVYDSAAKTVTFQVVYLVALLFLHELYQKVQGKFSVHSECGSYLPLCDWSCTHHQVSPLPS